MRSKAGRIGRVILFAMDGAFSRAVYQHLRDTAPGTVVALVPWSENPPGFPMVQVAGANSLLEEARRDGVALMPSDGTPAWLGRLREVAADFILVACFGGRIDQKTREVAHCGCLNLHPSMLPRYRGPAPVFWQLRHGEEPMGVTLHRLEDRMDAGDIAARKEVALPDGATAAAIDALLGHAGAGLFIHAASHWDAVEFVPQDEQQASRQSFPEKKDRRIVTDWPVLRAWNFMRGTGMRHTVFEVIDGVRLIRVRTPLGALPVEAGGCEADDAFVDLRFADGVLRAPLARDIG